MTNPNVSREDDLITVNGIDDIHEHFDGVKTYVDDDMTVEDWYYYVMSSVDGECSTLRMTKDAQYILESSLYPVNNKPLMTFTCWFATMRGLRHSGLNDNLQSHKEGLLVHVRLVDDYVADTFNDTIDNMVHCGVCDFDAQTVDLNYNDVKRFEKVGLSLYVNKYPTFSSKYCADVLTPYRDNSLNDLISLTNLFSVSCVERYNTFCLKDGEQVVGMVIAGSEVYKGHIKIIPKFTFSEWVNSSGSDFVPKYQQVALSAYNERDEIGVDDNEEHPTDKVILLIPNNVILVHPSLYKEYLLEAYSELYSSVTTEELDNTETGLSELWG